MAPRPAAPALGPIDPGQVAALLQALGGASALPPNAALQLAAQLAARLPPATVQAALAARTAQSPAAAAPAPPKPRFDLLAQLGDTSGPVSVQQAVLVQKAIKSSSNRALAEQLHSLVELEPGDMHNLLASNTNSIKDVSEDVRHDASVWTPRLDQTPRA